jgi:hypothetical protein
MNIGGEEDKQLDKYNEIIPLAQLILDLHIGKNGVTK